MTLSIAEAMASIPNTIGEKGRKIVAEILGKRRHEAAKAQAHLNATAVALDPDLIRRCEQLRIKLTLPGKDAKKYDKLVKVLSPNVVVTDGDTLHINYEFNVNYIGKIVESLGAIIALGKKGFIASADLDELIHGKSLLLEVVRLLDELPNYAEIEMPRS